MSASALRSSLVEISERHAGIPLPEIDVHVIAILARRERRAPLPPDPAVPDLPGGCDPRSPRTASATLAEPGQRRDHHRVAILARRERRAPRAACAGVSAFDESLRSS